HHVGEVTRRVDPVLHDAGGLVHGGDVGDVLAKGVILSAEGIQRGFGSAAVRTGVGEAGDQLLGTGIGGCLVLRRIAQCRLAAVGAGLVGQVRDGVVVVLAVVVIAVGGVIAVVLGAAHGAVAIHV